MIRSKQKTPSTCKALDNKKAEVKVGAGSVQRAQANEQAGRTSRGSVMLKRRLK